MVDALRKDKLKLTLAASPVERWGINWAGVVIAETADNVPRVIYLPGERTYDPAGLTGDAHASERIGKDCARTQAAIIVAQLNAINVGATLEQVRQIQGATRDVIVRYHGRLELHDALQHGRRGRGAELRGVPGEELLGNQVPVVTLVVGRADGRRVGRSVGRRAS